MAKKIIVIKALKDVSFTSLIPLSPTPAKKRRHSQQASHIPYTPTTIEDRLDFLHKIYAPFITPKSSVVVFHNLWGYGTPEIPITYEQAGKNPALFGALQPVAWNDSDRHVHSTNTVYRSPTIDLKIIGYVTPKISGRGGRGAIPQNEVEVTDCLLDAVQNILRYGAQLKSGLIINSYLAETLDVKSSPYSPREIYGVAVPASTYFNLQKTSPARQIKGSALFFPPLPRPELS